MEIQYPEELLTEEQWERHVSEQIPLLAHAWERGDFDKFYNLLALHDLSFKKYEDDWYSGKLYAPYIPIMRKAIPKMLSDNIASVQPMSDYTGEIFQFKTKNSQEKH